MPITIGCSSCQTSLKVADTLAGKAVKCPKCTSIIRVPASGGSAAAATPPPKSTAPLREPKAADPGVKAAPAPARPPTPKPKPKPPPDEEVEELEELDEVDDEEEPEVEAADEEEVDERPRRRGLVKDVSGRNLSIEHDVPEHLQTRVAEELSKGERLIWVAQPNKTLILIRSLGAPSAGSSSWRSPAASWRSWPAACSTGRPAARKACSWSSPWG